MTSVVLAEPQFADGVEYLADAPIDFLDPVAIDAVVRFALKSLAGIERKVDRRVGQVEEELLVVVFAEECDGFFCVVRDERGLVVGEHALETRFRCAASGSGGWPLLFGLGSGSPRLLFTPSAAGPMSLE